MFVCDFRGIRFVLSGQLFGTNIRFITPGRYFWRMLLLNFFYRNNSYERFRQFLILVIDIIGHIIQYLNRLIIYQIRYVRYKYILYYSYIKSYRALYNIFDNPKTDKPAHNELCTSKLRLSRTIYTNPHILYIYNICFRIYSCDLVCMHVRSI